MSGSGSASVSGEAAAPLYRYADGVLTLRLHVQPGAARSGWGGRHGDALKLRIAAPAVDGKANRTCMAWLAQAAGVPKGAVTLLRGRQSREKTVRIEPLTPLQFDALRRQWQR